MARVRQAAYREAAKAAFQGDVQPRVWEVRTAQRQALVRRTYLAQAQLLLRSPDVEDRKLGAKVEAFVREMPRPDSQRLALARELRAANAVPDRDRPAEGRDRTR